MTRESYRVAVERGEKYWLLHVDPSGIDRWTQARTLREVDTMARDLIALMRDVPEDSFDLDVDISVPDRARDLAVQAIHAQVEANLLGELATELLRQSAVELHRDGISMRDIGVVFGLSHQRVHQLIAGAGAGVNLEGGLELWMPEALHPEVRRVAVEIVGEPEPPHSLPEGIARRRGHHVPVAAGDG